MDQLTGRRTACRGIGQNVVVAVRQTTSSPNGGHVTDEIGREFIGADDFESAV